MRSLRNFLLFLAAAIFLAPAASSALAASTLWISGVSDVVVLTGVIRSWWLADAVGMAIVAPFALSISLRAIWQQSRSSLSASVVSQLMLTVLLSGLFYQGNEYILFFVFPLCIAATLAHRELGAVLSLFNVGVVVSLAMAAGAPALQNLSQSHEPLLLMQLLLGALVLATHPVSVVMKQLDGYVAEADMARRHALEQNAMGRKQMKRVGQEMRGPVTGVMILAERLKSEPEVSLSSQQTELLNRITDSSWEIDQLARSLLGAGQDAGPDNAENPRPQDLNALIETAVDAARYRGAAPGVWLTATYSERRIMVMAVQPLVIRLLTDWMLQTLVASTETVRIHIHTEEVSKDEVRLLIDDDDRASSDLRLSIMRESLSPDDAGVGPMSWRDREQLRLFGGDTGASTSPDGGVRYWMNLPLAHGLQTAELS